jgi:hypothetical protein
MVAAFPIGWAISKMVLAVVFIVVFVPIGLLFRLLGRDALRVRRPGQPSLWSEHATVSDSARYFRQY